MGATKAVETRRKKPRVSRDEAMKANAKAMKHKSLRKLREFCRDDAVARFRKFHAAVVARCIAYLYPDGVVAKPPNFRRVQTVNALVREATYAARVAAEAVGMTAKINTGKRTRSHGRVLEVGRVLFIAPVLLLGMHARNRLRMIRPDDRTVTRLVRVTCVHRLADGKVN